MRLGSYTPTDRDATVTLRGRPWKLALAFALPWVVGLVAIGYALVQVAT